MRFLLVEVEEVYTGIFIILIVFNGTYVNFKEKTKKKKDS